MGRRVEVEPTFGGYHPTMGLIDRLSDKTFDLVAADAMDRRAQRRALRAEAVAELTKYGASIERVRIAVLRLKDALGQPSMQLKQDALDEVAAAQMRELNEPGDCRSLEFGIMRLVDWFDYEAIERSMISETPPPLRKVVEHEESRSFRFLDAFQMADVARVDLDEAWARVRPVLDDAVEIETVIYLREFRHGLRGLLHELFTNASDLMSYTEPPASLVEALDLRIVQFLEASDAWQAHVGGVRRSLRP